MNKIFHFDSPREPYRCDAAVVWCFDDRFNVVFTKFLKRAGIASADPIKIAGGAKNLASPSLETDRDFILEQIRISQRLHGTKCVILMTHSDCGAYGGLNAFGGDTEAESKYHASELHNAAEHVQRAMPGIDVQTYFVDFEGVWEVEAATAQTE